MHLQVGSSRRYGCIKTSLRLNGGKPYRYLWSAVSSSMLADICHTALGVNALFINPEERRTVNTNCEEVWLKEVVRVQPGESASAGLSPYSRLISPVRAFSLRHKSPNAVNAAVLFQSNYFLMSHLSKSRSDRDWYCCKMSECAFFVTHGETKSQIVLNAQCIWENFSPVAKLTEFHTFNCSVGRVEVAVNESHC